MKLLTLVLFALAIHAKADWAEDYAKRHPMDTSRSAKSVDECKALQDTVMVKVCLDQKAERNPLGPTSEEDFVYDEQTTTVVAGDETTKTITTIKSRSGKLIAESVDGVKTALYVSMAISVGLSLIGIIAISGGR